jgi:hypothetical protein
MGTLPSLSKPATAICLSVSEYGLLIFALLVVVGLIGENKLPWWHHRLKIFEILVTIGCGGELLADGGVFVFSRRLQTIADGEFAVFNKEAATARKEAGDATKQAGDAIKEAAGVRLRAAELERETVLLREQLRIQGSRAALLMEVSSQSRFAKIERFKRQKVEIAQCGRQDNEITLAVITLMNLIRVRGWIVNPNNPFVSCATGLRVIVRHDAPESTLAAAKALGGVLNELGLMHLARHHLRK